MNDDMVPSVRYRERKQIERTAIGVLKAAAPDALDRPLPTPILDLLEHYLPKIGFEYHIANLPPGTEGITDPKERLVTLSQRTYDGLLNDDGRSRFTTAHEIGHAVLHGSELGDVSVSCSNLRFYRRSSLPVNINPEWQANEFAAYLLMPSKALSLIRRDHKAVATAFAVSYAAASLRIKRS